MYAEGERKAQAVTVEGGCGCVDLRATEYCRLNRATNQASGNDPFLPSYCGLALAHKLPSRTLAKSRR